MRVALLADIHGNADALIAVLDAVRKAGAGRILVAGDLVNYYYDAKRMFDMLDEWDWLSVRGNHDEMLEQWRRGEGIDMISAKYGTALDLTLRELSAERIDMLANMPALLDLNIDGRRVCVCHGTPWDRDEYVYPDTDDAVKLRFADDDFDLVVYGHTHYPAAWRAGKTLVVNPGSTGQPRDHKPGACWALWDTKTNTVEHRRESYDMEPLIARCKAHDPEVSFLWTVLTRTRQKQ
ncbi:MAG: metallophosphatase family protein [Rhodospirillaceae bacterium]|nr:metallophosphatase family protein [Rhodospirillaceae bacterium]